MSGKLDYEVVYEYTDPENGSFGTRYRTPTNSFEEFEARDKSQEEAGLVKVVAHGITEAEAIKLIEDIKPQYLVRSAIEEASPDHRNVHTFVFNMQMQNFIMVMGRSFRVSMERPLMDDKVLSVEDCLALLKEKTPREILLACVDRAVDEEGNFHWLNFEANLTSFNACAGLFEE